jgi:hypothetical protein
MQIDLLEMIRSTYPSFLMPMMSEKCWILIVILIDYKLIIFNTLMVRIAIATFPDCSISMVLFDFLTTLLLNYFIPCVFITYLIVVYYSCTVGVVEQNI